MNQKQLSEYMQNFSTKKQEIFDLPDGWIWEKINNLCFINKSSKNPKKEFPNKFFNYIDIGSIENGVGKIIAPKKMKGKDAPSRARRLIQTNNIIMSTVRPYLKGFALVPKIYDGEICSTGFAVLEAKKNTNPKYILYALFSDIVIEQCNKMMMGAHYPALTKDQIGSLQIPIPISVGKPDLIIQQRIVQKIENLFNRIHRVIKLTKDKKIEAFTKSVYLQVFSKIQRDGKLITLKDISKKPKYGYTASANLNQIGPKFLRITDIQNGSVNWDTVPYCLIDDCDIDNFKIKEDDIFFARTGATTGKSLYIKSIDQDAVFASYLIRIRIQKDKALPEYVYHFFQSPQYWNQITPQGGAQPHMNAQKLMKLRVPIPYKNNEIDITMQEEVIDYLNKINNYSLFLTKRNQEILQKLDKLKISILDRAFKGVLM